MTTEQIVGAVLAGGASRRLGHPKEESLIGGLSLLDRAVGVLGQLFSRVVVSASRPDDDCGREVVVDNYRGSGPLAGLEAALEAAGGLPVFLLACDLPLVDAIVVRRILDHAEKWPKSEPCAWVACGDGSLQPLCGLYSPACQKPVRENLENRRLSFQELLSCIEVIEVKVDDLKQDVLLNVNRPGDLEQARGSLGEE